MIKQTEIHSWISITHEKNNNQIKIKGKVSIRIKILIPSTSFKGLMWTYTGGDPRAGRPYHLHKTLISYK